MIKRKSYMKRIRPFFGNDLVKALIGLHVTIHSRK